MGGLQYLINERLATRSGSIGNLFKAFRIGERDYGQHSLFRFLKVCNFFWVSVYQFMGMQRHVFSRFIGVTNGPLNYSGLFVWFFCTNMMFPPNFLHNRISAHYIEINHIFAVEMIRKYQVARREILAERDASTAEERATKYSTNPTYVWEPLGKDDDKIQRMKDDGVF